jgi:hypothetical protein
VGLVGFALVAWLLLGDLPTWVVLLLATLAWTGLSLGLYVAQRVVLRRRGTGPRRG